MRRTASCAWSVERLLHVSPQTRHRCAAEEGARFTAQSARKDEQPTRTEQFALQAAACLLSCGGESRQTARFETRSRARVRAGAQPAVRIARFGRGGFVQALGQGLAGSRVVVREIERVRESPCA